MDTIKLLQKKKKLLKLLLVNIDMCKQQNIKINRNSRRMWIRKCITARVTRGEGSALVQEIRLEDSLWYYNYTRMTPEYFDILLNLVKPFIQKQETNLRQPIPPNICLLITLRYKLFLFYLMYFYFTLIFLK